MCLRSRGPTSTALSLTFDLSSGIKCTTPYYSKVYLIRVGLASLIEAVSVFSYWLAQRACRRIDGHPTVPVCPCFPAAGPRHRGTTALTNSMLPPESATGGASLLVLLIFFIFLSYKRTRWRHMAVQCILSSKLLPLSSTVANDLVFAWPRPTPWKAYHNSESSRAPLKLILLASSTKRGS